MRALIRNATMAVAILVLVSATAHAVYTNTTIYNIRTGMHALADSLRINNVVVVGIDIRPTTFGVYVQEQAGGPFSGLLAYRGGSTPVYACGDPVAVGDIIDVEGIYTEFVSGGGSLTQLTNPILYPDSTVLPPAPVVISACSLHTDSPNAERWEGVLVRVENVAVGAVNSFGNWYLDLIGCGNLTSPTRRNSVLSGYEKMISGQVVPLVGDTLASVTGVAQWEFGERRIAPRNSDDLVFTSQGPAPDPNLVYSSSENQIKVRFNVALSVASAQDVNNYALSTFETITSAVYNASTKTVTLTTGTNLVPDATTPHILTVQDVRNANNRIMAALENFNFIGGISTISFIQTPVSATNDSSRVNFRQVSFRGVVTASGGCGEFPPGTGFYVQQRGVTQFGGIFVFGSPFAPPARNDSVFVSGAVSEFGIGPETQIVSVDEVTVLGGVSKSSANGMPSILAPPILPIEVTAPDLTGPNNDPVAERYEGMLVRMNNVTVLTQAGSGNSFDVAVSTAGIDTVRVDDLAIEESAYTPWRGDVIDVVGVIRFSGTVPYRRVQPRNWSEPPTGDIHVDSKAQVSDAPPPVYRTQLAQNEPNPFNPSTAIAYSIAKPGHASLRIFNLNGRLVTTLLDREVVPGPGSVIWNGQDSNGRRAPSGVYVYRLLNADGELSRKMVLLK